VFGAAIDESLGDEVKVTVIATGFESKPVYYADSREDERNEPSEDDEHRASRGLFGTMPEVDTELPAFLRRGVTTR
jgi:cell division protein FtsZ